MRINKGGITNDFIEMKKRQFVIPVYQRNYEWSEVQCRKLFADIITAHEKERDHFCGSIVFSELHTVNKITRYVIIDGQQRLTTIYILIKALMDSTKSQDQREQLRESLLNKDKFNQYTTDQASKLKLKPIKSDNDQLLLLMEDRQPDMKQDSGIMRNYQLFLQLIAEYLDEDPERDVTCVYDGIDRLTCAVIELDDDDDNAQEIFERINSTGVPLSLADKIRNYVLMSNADQDRLYEQYWLPAEQLVGADQMSTFFIDYLNMKNDSFVRYEDAYDAFKRLHDDSRNNSEAILAEIFHYARQYAAFLHGSPELTAGINLHLEQLRSLKQSMVYLFLFHVFDDREAGIVSDAEVEKLLRLLLCYSIRRLVCEISSNSLRGLYKTLYARIFVKPEHLQHYYDSVISFLRHLNSRDAIPSDEAFVAALRTTNLYRKNALCKLLLVSIENRGKEPIRVDDLSIEHIMPQNHYLSTEWQRMLGTEWERVHASCLHTLGNLALTGYNSELGDKPFAEKKRLLTEQTTHITELYKDILSAENWNERAIYDRCDRLTTILMDLFRIEPPQVAIDFRDPRYTEYTLEDPSVATNKHVNYYVLLGERVIVDSYAQMLRSVITKLYEYDNSVIDRMARNNECFPGWVNPAFSYTSDGVRNPIHIRLNKEFYCLGVASAIDIAYFIRALLRAYDLSIEEDFVYSARASSSSANVIDRIEIAKKWCERKAAEGMIGFSRAFCSYGYTRFTTRFLESNIPTHPDRLSPWQTPNYCLYEIKNLDGKLLIQLMFYCLHLTPEMRAAYRRLADALGVTITWRGYTGYFYSTVIPHQDTDTPETVFAQLELLFREVQAFEHDAELALNALPPAKA